MTNIRKSYRLSRFHLVLALIVILLLMGLLLRFFDMIQASIEEVSVEINLLNMQQMMHIQNILTKSKDPHCNILDKPDLFQQIDPSAAGSSKTKAIPGTWQYEPEKHQITYNVISKSYFRSEISQKIVIDLYCNKGIIVFKEKSFQWCHDKKIWGCRAW